MRGLLILTLISAVGPIWAQTNDKAPSPPPAASRPRASVNKPVELLKCKPASSKGEAKAREAAEAANFSDHEVLSRLIFTESLSTGFWTKKCNAASAESLMEAIGWLIVNRVDKYSPKRDDPRPDAFFHVIFAPKQFRTSFSSKGDNPFARSFLCPLEAQKYFASAGVTDEAYNVYAQAKEVAAHILDKYQRTGLDPHYSKIVNVFYPYSEFGGQDRPTWAKDPDPTENKGFVKLIEGEKPCAEFYRR